MKKVLFFTFSSIILLAFIIKLINHRNDDGGFGDEKASFAIHEDNWDVSGVNDSHVEDCLDSSVIIHYLGFDVCYDTKKLQPVWVDYTLTKEQVWATENTPKIPHHFMQDPNLSLPQASDEDYKGVHKLYGLSKGHMARHQDMKWSLQATQESDYYTNICPQHEKLNTKLWKRIENLVREIAVQYDSVHVICGPIFTDYANGYIGPNRIPVPDYFFKALLVKDATGYQMIAFLCPNNDTPLTMREAACTIDKVESLSQIDIYSYLPDTTESTVESTYNTKLLGLR